MALACWRGLNNGNRSTAITMQTDDVSTTFMSDVYSRLKNRQGDNAVMDKDSTVIDTSIGPCLVMGAVSWMVLFAVYHWLA